MILDASQLGKGSQVIYFHGYIIDHSNYEHKIIGRVDIDTRQFFIDNLRALIQRGSDKTTFLAAQVTKDLIRTLNKQVNYYE